MSIAEIVSGGICSSINCRTTNLVQSQRVFQDSREQIQERLENEIDEMRSNTAIKYGCMKDDLACIEVPAISIKASPTNKNTRRRFIRDLIVAIRAAFKYQTPLEEDRKEKLTRARTQEQVLDANESTIVAKACSFCKGSCCWHGEKQPYLTATDIRSYIESQPGITAGEVYRRYRDLLPESSITRSCVYHTVTGCSLPQNMRSSLCNQFICNALNEAIETKRNGNKKITLFYDTKNHKINSMEVVEL